VSTILHASCSPYYWLIDTWLELERNSDIEDITQMPWSPTAAGRVNSSALMSCTSSRISEALGVHSGSLVYRWARHFQTAVYVVAIVSAVGHGVYLGLLCLSQGNSKKNFKIRTLMASAGTGVYTRVWGMPPAWSLPIWSRLSQGDRERQSLPAVKPITLFTRH